MFAARNNYLRLRHGHEHHRVTFVELFFDLVFVFAITQLSHGLLHHLTPLGAFADRAADDRGVVGWIDTAWVTNWLDPEQPPVRLLLFALMLGGLVLVGVDPEGVRGAGARLRRRLCADAGSAATCSCCGRCSGMTPANYLQLRADRPWHVAAAPFWIAGALRRWPERASRCGRVAVAIETSAPMVGFYVPGLGRSRTADWEVEGEHMAERCGLFVIIALGEFDPDHRRDLRRASPGHAATVAAFVVAFVGSVAMWAIYFNIGAERSSRLIAGSDDPGRIARSGYTYIHILIVAGIIVVAVGDELVLHHPRGHTEWKSAPSSSAARRSIWSAIAVQAPVRAALAAVASGRAWTARADRFRGPVAVAARALRRDDFYSDRGGGVGVVVVSSDTSSRSESSLSATPETPPRAHGAQQMHDLERRIGISDALRADVGDAVAVGVGGVGPRLPGQIGAHAVRRGEARPLADQDHDGSRRRAPARSRRRRRRGRWRTITSGAMRQSFSAGSEVGQHRRGVGLHRAAPTARRR